MSTHKIRLFAISAIAVLALSVGVFYQSVNDSPYNEVPPNLEEVSSLTGATTKGSSAAYYYDSNSPDYIGNSSSSDKFDRSGVNFMYSNTDSTMKGFLSRINGLNSGQFRFLSFGRSGRSGKYLALPAEYYTSNYGVSKYCCGSLSDNSSILKNRVVLVYNSSSYEYFPNPSEELMNSGTVDVSYDGWHLVWLGNKNDLKLPTGSQVLSAWGVPNDGSEAYQVYSADSDDVFDVSKIDSGIFWLKVGAKESQSDMLGVPEDDPRYEQLSQIAELIKAARQDGAGGDVKVNVTNVSVGNINANCFNSLLGDNNSTGNFTDSCNSTDIALLSNPEVLNEDQVPPGVIDDQQDRIIMTPTGPSSRNFFPFINLDIPFKISFNNETNQVVNLESFKVELIEAESISSVVGAYDGATKTFTFNQNINVPANQTVTYDFEFKNVTKNAQLLANFSELETSLQDSQETILLPNMIINLNDFSDQLIPDGRISSVFAPDFSQNLCSIIDSVDFNHQVLLDLTESGLYTMEFEVFGDNPGNLNIESVNINALEDLNFPRDIVLNFSDFYSGDVSYTLKKDGLDVASGSFTVNLNQIDCSSDAANIQDFLDSQNLGVQFELINSNLEVCALDEINDAVASITLRNNSIVEINLNSIEFQLAGETNFVPKLNGVDLQADPENPMQFNFPEDLTLEAFEFVRLDVVFSDLQNVEAFEARISNVNITQVDIPLTYNSEVINEGDVDQSKFYSFVKSITNQCAADFRVKFNPFNPDNNSVAKFFAYNDGVNESCITNTIFEFSTFNGPIANLDFDLDIFDVFINASNIFLTPSNRCLLGLALDAVNQPIILVPGFYDVKYTIQNTYEGDPLKCYAEQVTHNGLFISLTNSKLESVDVKVKANSQVDLSAITTKFNGVGVNFAPIEAEPDAYFVDLSLPASMVSRLEYEVSVEQMEALINEISFTVESNSVEVLPSTVSVKPFIIEELGFLGDFDINGDNVFQDNEDLNDNDIMEFNSPQLDCSITEGFLKLDALSGILASLNAVSGGLLDDFNLTIPNLGGGLNYFAFFDSLNNNQASIKDVANDLIAYTSKTQIAEDTPFAQLIPNYCQDNQDSEFCLANHPAKNVEESLEYYSLKTTAGDTSLRASLFSSFQSLTDLINRFSGGQQDEDDINNVNLESGNNELVLIDEKISKIQNNLVVDVSYDKNYPIYQNDDAPTFYLREVLVNITNNTQNELILNSLTFEGSNGINMRSVDYENVVVDGDNLIFGTDDNSFILRKGATINLPLRIIVNSSDQSFDIDDLTVNFKDFNYSPTAGINVIYRYHNFNSEENIFDFETNQSEISFDGSNQIDLANLNFDKIHTLEDVEFSLCVRNSYPARNLSSLHFKTSLPEEDRDGVKLKISTNYPGSSLSFANAGSKTLFNSDNPIVTDVAFDEDEFFTPIALFLDTADLFYDNEGNPFNITYEVLDSNAAVVSSVEVPLLVNYLDCGVSSTYEAPVKVLLDSVDLVSNTLDEYTVTVFSDEFDENSILESLNEMSHINLGEGGVSYKHDFYDYINSETLEIDHTISEEKYLMDMFSLKKVVDLIPAESFDVVLEDQYKFIFDIPFVVEDGSGITHYEVESVAKDFPVLNGLKGDVSTAELPADGIITVDMGVAYDLQINFQKLVDEKPVTVYSHLLPVNLERTTYPVKYAKPIVNINDSSILQGKSFNLYFSDLNQNIKTLNAGKQAPDDYLFMDYMYNSLGITNQGHDMNVIKLDDMPKTLNVNINQSFEYERDSFIASFVKGFLNAVYTQEDRIPFVSKYLNAYQLREAEYLIENSNLPFMKFELSDLNSEQGYSLSDIKFIDFEFEVSDSQVVETFIADAYVSGTPVGLSFINDGSQFLMAGLTYQNTNEDSGNVSYRIDLSSEQVVQSLALNEKISIFTFMMPLAMPTDLPDGYNMTLKDIQVIDSQDNTKSAGLFEDMDENSATPTINFNANNISTLLDPIINTYFSRSRNYISADCNFAFVPSILTDDMSFGTTYQYYNKNLKFKYNLMNRIYETQDCAAR